VSKLSLIIIQRDRYLHAQLLEVGAFSQILSFARRINTVDPHY